MSETAQLNGEQQAAVAHTGCPLLVLAGAGSGKTRVITQRIVRLIQGGAGPILAMTFTNKAAAEMRGRVQALLPGREPEQLFLGTFHAWGLRVLRRHAPGIGLDHDFLVYDRGDQLEVLKKTLGSASSEDRESSPRRLLGQISKARNRLEAVSAEGQLYLDALHGRGAVDYDDLLLLPLQLLRRRADLADQLRPSHILVDEFQDTSPAQAALVEALWPTTGDVCVVGDEDQAIYGFRGATVANILAFTRAHPDAKTIRLVRNYRSTQPIVQAASILVGHNRERLGKKLVAEIGPGDPIAVVRCTSPEHEAEQIVERARRWIDRFGAGQVGVLFRTNAQSRAIEEALVRASVPYHLVKGQRFYDRREIKDIIGYLRLIVSPQDDVVFDRVVNVPARGIGASAKDELARIATADALSLWLAATQLVDQGSAVGRRLQPFVQLIQRLQAQLEELPVAAVIRAVAARSGYLQMLQRESAAGDGEQRAANVEELARKAELDGQGTGRPALVEFLDQLAIATDPEMVEGAVLLLTLHNAKGLEFDAVVIAGVEEGLLPHGSTGARWGSDAELEEERRLFYVGMTRARRNLALTYVPGRRLWNDQRVSQPSRFLDELPREHLTFEGVQVPAPTPTAPATMAPSGDPRRATPGSGRSVHGAAPARAKPSAPAAAASVPFAVGGWVRHKTYGDGVVLEREGSGELLKLTVRFSSGMRKKLVAKYAALQPLTRTGRR